MLMVIPHCQERKHEDECATPALDHHVAVRCINTQWSASPVAYNWKVVLVNAECSHFVSCILESRRQIAHSAQWRLRATKRVELRTRCFVSVMVGCVIRTMTWKTDRNFSETLIE